MPHAGGPASPAKTTTRPEARTALLALRSAGQNYRFLDLGYRYLAAVDDDPQITLEIVKALVELGLCGPARELLQQRRDLTGAGIDFSALRRNLDSVPTGRIPWEQLQDRFAANMEVLVRLHPHFRGREAEMRGSLQGFQLFGSRDGLVHLSRREPGRMRTWLPGLTDHAGAEAAEPRPQDLPQSILIVSLPLNEFIEHIFAATAGGADPRQTSLFLADSRWHQLAAWLHVADRSAILADPRVFLFGGPDAAAEYERFLSDNEDLEIPSLRLGCYAADDLCRPFDEATRRVQADRQSRYRSCIQRLSVRAERREGPRAGRLAPGARVLGFASRYTTMLRYSMRDIGAALQRLGYEFRLVMEPDDRRRSNALVVARSIETFDPDLIVLINHFRHELPDPMAGVPILTWVQDPTDLVFSRRTGESLGTIDFVCGYYQEPCTSEFGYPPSRFFNVTLPVSSGTFHDGPVEADEATRSASDIVYVGHLHHTAQEHREAWRSSSPQHVQRLLDRLFREITALHERGEHMGYVREPRELIERIAAEMGLALDGPAVDRISAFFAHRLYDILFRRETLLWVARWAQRSGRRFRIYGKGWARDPVLGAHAAGPIEHGEPLRRVYRCSRLAVQTIPGGFKHQRSFEALLSGCLVLGRYVPTDFGNLSLPEYSRRQSQDNVRTGSTLAFPALDRVVFRDAEDVPELAEAFLNDEALYRQVQGEFADIVRRNFTYDVVVGDVMERIRAALAAQTPLAGTHGNASA